MTTHPTPAPRTHTKHDDWWCECGLRIEDCDDLQEQLATPAAPRTAGRFWFAQGTLIHGNHQGGIDIGPFIGEAKTEAFAKSLVEQHNASVRLAIEAEAAPDAALLKALLREAVDDPLTFATDPDGDCFWCGGPVDPIQDHDEQEDCWVARVRSALTPPAEEK